MGRFVLTPDHARSLGCRVTLAPPIPTGGPCAVLITVAVEHTEHMIHRLLCVKPTDPPATNNALSRIHTSRLWAGCGVRSPAWAIDKQTAQPVAQYSQPVRCPALPTVPLLRLLVPSGPHNL